MKKLSTLAGTLLLVGTLSSQPMGNMSGMGSMSGMGGRMMAMHGMMGGMTGMHGMMEPMLPHLLMKARQMAPDKGDALRDLVSTKLPEFLRQKTEVQIAKIQLAMLLQDPKASERDLEKAFDRLEQARMKLQKINREGILELRKVLGAEAFSRLFGMQGMTGMGGMPMMRGMPSPRMQEMMKRMGNMPMMPVPSAPADKSDE